MESAASASETNLLVIGYGNTLRSDDGLGPRVADAVSGLGLPGVHALSCGLLTPELADPVSKARCVVFVDAAVDAPGEVQLRPLSAAESPQILAHASDPRTLLALARDVFGNAPKAWLLTIPAENLAIGEALSEKAQRGFVVALQEIAKLASLDQPSPRTN
jgi:hydrogenase maturation protease